MSALLSSKKRNTSRYRVEKIVHNNAQLVQKKTMEPSVGHAWSKYLPQQLFYIIY